MGWLVEANHTDCTITSLVLTAWKSRQGKSEAHKFRLVNGRPVEQANTSVEDAVFNFIVKNEGKTRDAIEKEGLCARIRQDGGTRLSCFQGVL